MKSTGRAYYSHMSLLPSIHTRCNIGMPLIVESKEKTSGKNCKWVVSTWKYWRCRCEVGFIRWSPRISQLTGDWNNLPRYWWVLTTAQIINESFKFFFSPPVKTLFWGEIFAAEVISLRREIWRSRVEGQKSVPEFHLLVIKMLSSLKSKNNFQSELFC